MVDALSQETSEEILDSNDITLLEVRVFSRASSVSDWRKKEVLSIYILL